MVDFCSNEDELCVEFSRTSMTFMFGEVVCDSISFLLSSYFKIPCASHYFWRSTYQVALLMEHKNDCQGMMLECDEGYAHNCDD